MLYRAFNWLRNTDSRNCGVRRDLWKQL
jgi:hypothetical protein